jgi:hypothetical protein
MVIDDELLEKAKDAGAQLTEAERQAAVARGDYHTMIRRMHLAGGSLREIAEALSISHQRVGQIVEQAGGSWWHRIWKTRTPKRDTVCTFCDRPPSEVAKLVSGPNVFICDGCIARADKKRFSARARCSFCDKRKAGVVGVEAAAVCPACLAICNQILEDRAG